MCGSAQKVMRANKDKKNIEPLQECKTIYINLKKK